MRNFFAIRGKWKGNASLYYHQYGLNSFRSVLVRKYRLTICDLVFRVSCFLVGDTAKHVDAFDRGLFFVSPAII